MALLLKSTRSYERDLGENKLGEPIGVLKSTRSYERDRVFLKENLHLDLLKSTRSYERDPEASAAVASWRRA